MPDSKITALTSISTSTDPANDPLVIVDVSDTSMAATGTTKKVTLNQLLGASGTATLASATITGDLTVTGNGLFTGTGFVALQRPLIPVGENGNTSLDYRWYSTGTTYVTGARISASSEAAWTASSTPSRLFFSTVPTGSTSPVERYRIGQDGTSTWYVGGTTAMTLNSTGLGVGVVPSTYKLEVGNGSVDARALFKSNNAFSIGVQNGASGIGGWIGSTGNNILTFSGNDGTMKVTISDSGNVGVGVTPSAIFNGGGTNGKGLQGDTWTISSKSGTNDAYFASNLYTSAYDVWSNRVNAASGAYYISGGTHIFYRGAAQAAGTITPTESARIDASGNLILSPSNTPPSLFANGQLTVNATSNTNLRFSYRGSDGVTRVANLTLA